MAKRVRISPDDGTTFYTFPGNTAELSREGQDLKDTIFGQNYESGMTGLFSGSISANGLYKGFAGYMAKIKRSGTSTTLTTEAMSLVAGKTYKVTDATKNVLNRAVTVTVFDNAVNHTADVESIDFLHGRVTFASGYTVTGPVTITGAYFPMTQVASARTYNLTQTANAVDNSVFETVQANGGYRTFEAGLKTVKLSLGGVYNASNNFETLLASRAELMMEIDPAGNGKSIARGFFRPMSMSQSGDVGDLEEQTLDFTLAVPDQENVSTVFSWVHAADTTLNRSIREAILAWENDEETTVDYLPDGEAGFVAPAIVTDLSLSGGMEAMNEYTVKFQLSGAPEATP
jgi:hypothetical protein